MTEEEQTPKEIITEVFNKYKVNSDKCVRFEYVIEMMYNCMQEQARQILSEIYCPYCDDIKIIECACNFCSNKREKWVSE